MQELEPGKIFNERYKILKELKGGSMATVYVALDQKNAQTVALKVLREDLAALPEFVSRFRREAEKLKKLAHGDIVRIWDFERRGSLAYISMEYIEGGTLLKKIGDLEGRPMPAEDILNIMTPVCNALSMAHGAGIVHCDIKPANIMIRSGGRAVVTDFGIAKEVEATATMEYFGTSAYMSPEQIQGAVPTPQMDIYALGVILYQLVTGGHRPFTGQNAKITGTTSEKTRWEQLNAQPKEPGSLNKSISPEMESLIIRCLQKEPNRRFKSTQELLQGLEAIPIYVKKPVSRKEAAILQIEKTSKTRAPSTLGQAGKQKRHPAKIRNTNRRNRKQPRARSTKKNTQGFSSDFVGIIVISIFVLFVIYTMATN